LGILLSFSIFALIDTFVTGLIIWFFLK
jgi:hypothetical protein